jgi:S-DNA-T family DNA segregation ATPase FtsK/SpoIIIE
MFRRTLAQPAPPPWRPLMWRRAVFAGTLLAWFCRGWFRAARFGWRHREGLTTVALVVALYWLMGELDTRPRQAAVGLLLVACLAWVVWQPKLCGTNRPLLAAWRRMAVYRREWGPAMTLAGLGHRRVLPRLLGVEVDGVMDVVRVEMLPGQVPDDWHQKRERLAQVFGARLCTVYAVGDRSPVLLLEFAARPGPAAPDDGSW